MIKLLKLNLQFFADKEEKEEEVVVEGEVVTPTVTPTVPAFTAPAAPEKLTQDAFRQQNGFMDEKQWYASQGFDPDADLQNNVAAINYEYQTSLENYGQNAEQLFQMGLQNSGVSDVYGANAFSAFVKAMNDSHLAYINAKKQNKIAYGNYVAGENTKYNEYSAAWDNERQTNLNNAIQYAMQNYNGYNLEDIKQNLAVSGYDQGIIDDVSNRLSSINPAQLQGATAMSLVKDIYTLMPGFTGSDSDIAAIKNMFGSSVNADLLDSAIEMAKAQYEGSTEAQQTTINNFVTEWGDTFNNSMWANPNMTAEEFLSSNGIVTDPNAEGFDQTKYDNAKAAWEQMNTSFNEKKLYLDNLIYSLFRDKDNANTWDNSETSNNELNRYFDTIDITEPEKQYIKNKLNERIKSTEDAVIKDTVNAINNMPTEDVAYDTLFAEVKNSNKNPEIVNAASVKYKGAVLNAMNNAESLSSSWSLIPDMDETKWNELNNAGKFEAMLDGIGQAHKNGLITNEDYESVIKLWAIEEIKTANIESLNKTWTKVKDFVSKYDLSNETKTYILNLMNISVTGVGKIFDGGQGVISSNIITSKGDIPFMARKMNLTKENTEKLTAISETNNTLFIDHDSRKMYYSPDGKQYYEITSNDSINLILLLRDPDLNRTPSENKNGGRTQDFAAENK